MLCGEGEESRVSRPSPPTQPPRGATRLPSAWSSLNIHFMVGRSGGGRASRACSTPAALRQPQQPLCARGAGLPPTLRGRALRRGDWLAGRRARRRGDVRRHGLAGDGCGRRRATRAGSAVFPGGVGAATAGRAHLRAAPAGGLPEPRWVRRRGRPGGDCRSPAQSHSLSVSPQASGARGAATPSSP